MKIASIGCGNIGGGFYNLFNSRIEDRKKKQVLLLN